MCGRVGLGFGVEGYVSQVKLSMNQFHESLLRVRENLCWDAQVSALLETWAFAEGAPDILVLLEGTPNS